MTLSTLGAFFLQQHPKLVQFLNRRQQARPRSRRDARPRRYGISTNFFRWNRRRPASHRCIRLLGATPEPRHGNLIRSRPWEIRLRAFGVAGGHKFHDRLPYESMRNESIVASKRGLAPCKHQAAWMLAISYKLTRKLYSSCQREASLFCRSGLQATVRRRLNRHGDVGLHLVSVGQVLQHHALGIEK